MSDDNLLSLFVRPLVTANIPYFITGGLATVIYGEPRFTRDIDLVLGVRPVHAQRLASLWSDAQFYVPPLETLQEESARSRYGHFNIIHISSGLTADCYVAGDDPLHDWAFARLRSFDVDDLRISVAPVEYVILRKLSYFTQSGSTRHLEDIERMCRVQGTAIDTNAIERWAGLLEVGSAWEKVRPVR